MARITPFKGANTAQFYVAEVTPGVTPTNPIWSPLRNTGGVPAITRDSLVSNELDGSRETTSVRLGSKQVSGEYAIELSARSQDDFLAGALSSTWEDGISHTGLSVAVDATAKTWTRSAGNFLTDGVAVGDLIAFPDLTGNNKLPFIVTSVNDTVVAGAGVQAALTTAAAATTDYVTGDRLVTGSQCKTFSILTWFKGECGGDPAYLLTKGVEISGFTIEQAVNAMVTGSFPFIGTDQEQLMAPPAGSDFTTVVFDDEQFSSVDVSAFNGISPMKLINTFTITNDNSASAQFELGDDGVSFVEKGRAANTFSLAGMMYDLTLYNAFLNEELAELTSILARSNEAMSFTLKRCRLTAATPEIGGPESVTLSMEGQAQGTANQSSIVIQRLSYAP
jgi:hypothetical protein